MVMSNSFTLTNTEENLKAKIAELKQKSGSHSPSISSLKQALAGDVEFKVDDFFHYYHI